MQIVDGGFPLASFCLCLWPALSSFESEEVKRNERRGGQDNLTAMEIICAYRSKTELLSEAKGGN